MPVGNLQQARADRSTLPAWPEPVEFLRDSYSVSLHLEYLDYNPRALALIFGAEYVLALQFSRLYEPMWWMDGIRTVQPEAPAVQPVPRESGEVVPAGAGATGDGQRDGADSTRREVSLESDGRQHDYVPGVADGAPEELSQNDSVDTGPYERSVIEAWMRGRQ